MKIGIVTLNGYFNYGNRLQNYALQQVLINDGYNVETVVFEIDNKTKHNEKKNKENLTNRVGNIKGKSALYLYNRVLTIINSKINKRKYINSNLRRQEIFIQFTEQNIIEKHIRIKENQLPESLLKEYDFFITGSDQVWNPNYNDGLSINFLTFFDSDRSIAYAPSFGVSQIPLEDVNKYESWIEHIGHLSVREVDGAKIIKELTGRDAPVLVDPTLLITKEKWLSIAKEANNKPKGKYLLTYFLGGVPDVYIKQIKNTAKKNNLEVINLGDIRESETYRTGPSEFIDYINNCSVFCTDSFHGAVFSILLEKPFIVFKRIGSASMYSRIDTLLNKFELNSRKVENISWGDDVFRIDFSHIPKILDDERKKSLDYLKNALKIKDAN